MEMPTVIYRTPPAIETPIEFCKPPQRMNSSTEEIKTPTKNEFAHRENRNAHRE